METPIHPLKLPLCQADYQQAIAQANNASDPAIAQQIKCGMLAALSARYYLKLLGIASELSSELSSELFGESSGPHSAAIGVQSLQISPTLALRCLPVIVGQPLNHRSLHHKSSTVGCLGTLAVQVDLSRRESKLLGFVPAECVTEPSAEHISFSALQPLTALISRLSETSMTHLQKWLVGKAESNWQQISQSQTRFFRHLPARTPCFRSTTTPPAEASSAEASPSEAALLETIHHSPDDEQRWQAAESLWSLNPAHPASPILRAKDLGLYLEGHTITLLVGILAKPNQERLILIRLLPFGENPYLPCNLALTGFNEAGDTVFSIQSRSQDDFIQFKFTAAAGDRFTLNISRNAARVTEHFIV